MIKRIRFENLKNTRDLGGFETASGRHIRPGRLIRSGALANASANDLDKLVDGIGIGSVIDLRTDIEIYNAPDPEIEGVDYIKLPLLDDSFFGIARDEYSMETWLDIFKDPSLSPAAIFGNMYRKLTFDERVKQYVRQFFGILAEADRPVLWHCSAGKDRVGVMTALLLYALDVPYEQIVRDYLMTGFFTFPEIAKTVVFGSLKFRDKRKTESIRVLMGVRSEYLDNIFLKISEDYKDVFDFFEGQFGIGKELIMKLRDKYLE